MEKKKTVLELYWSKGWLNNPRSKWSADDRLAVGLRLSKDYYKAQLEQVTGIDYSKDRVDTSTRAVPDYLLEARDKFNKAICSIPHDFWEPVQYVCCENRMLKGVGESERQRDYDRYRKAFDLCRGLDYLVEFYLKSSRK